MTIPDTNNHARPPAKSTLQISPALHRRRTARNHQPGPSTHNACRTHATHPSLQTTQQSAQERNTLTYRQLA
eukprot:15445307-Alexandrium_andersonii.AAC.1